jgi:phenylalanyl-tRNA synthetase beta chain
VEDIHYVGWAMPADGSHGFKTSGISWDREKIVVAEILEVGPHPNADRLTLCKLNDGQQEHTVLTGAPNLFDYKGKGPLPKPIKVAYAREGATIYDGHAEGLVLTTSSAPRSGRGILLDGLLGKRAGHQRGARGHYLPR